VAEAASWPYREQIKVRYQEVDAQKVVFNAHYLGWCDVANAGWAEHAMGWTGVDDQVDWMVVRVVLEWQGSAGYGDVVDLDCGVHRWGNTSFDVAYRGTVAGRPVFTGTITYVTIEPGTTTPVRVPDRMRTALGAAPDADPG
jgi:acyl-CoA thioester hydrolase